MHAEKDVRSDIPSIFLRGIAPSREAFLMALGLTRSREATKEEF